MTWLGRILAGAALWVAPSAWAMDLPGGFDVYVLGEVHDNPAHHARQADAIAAVAPRAVVFEMLTPDEAKALADAPRTSAEMRAATAGFHWGNIADYAAVLAVSPIILGAALPRSEVRSAFGQGAAAVFAGDAQAFGLTVPLPPDQQETREAAQFAAHCEAMPRDMMSGMVEAQRLRDAEFARVVLWAFESYGAPVVLITGNGHARKDWGVPAYLARVAPRLRVFALGQGEAGAVPGGAFDQLADAPQVDRGDPCAAFQ